MLQQLRPMRNSSLYSFSLPQVFFTIVFQKTVSLTKKRPSLSVVCNAWTNDVPATERRKAIFLLFSLSFLFCLGSRFIMLGCRAAEHVDRWKPISKQVFISKVNAIRNKKSRRRVSGFLFSKGLKIKTGTAQRTAPSEGNIWVGLRCTLEFKDV